VGKLLEKFGALNAGTRLAVSFLLLGLIVGGYFYWLYLPKREELAKAKATLEATEAKLAESRKTAAQLPKFKEEVQRLNQELVLALAQLPEEKDIPDLLAQVSRAGQESGLEVLSFRPGSEQREGIYASIPVQMRATGTFHQLLTFFDRVSRLPRIVTIRDVSMSDPKEANGRFGLAATFNATTYRFLPDGEPAPAAAGGRKERKSGQ
jgi:type IV pilus assembly protein PilO